MRSMGVLIRLALSLVLNSFRPGSGSVKPKYDKVYQSVYFFSASTNKLC